MFALPPRAAGNAWSLPFPNGLVSGAAKPGRAHPPTASRARGTLRGFQGDSNFALQQRAASVHEERRHSQRGPLPTIRGMEIVKAQWLRAVTLAASVPHPTVILSTAR